MDALKIHAKDFDTREQIDRYISLECGEDASTNRIRGHQIFGTIENLKRIGLSEGTRVHGVRCVILLKG